MSFFFLFFFFFAYKICLCFVAGFISLRVLKNLSSGDDWKQHDSTRVATSRKKGFSLSLACERPLVICKLALSADILF